MRSRFTISEKQRGEIAARDLSKKAYAFYSGTVPFSIFEVAEEDEKLYAYGFSDSYRKSDYTDLMSFEKLNEELTALAEECGGEAEE